MRAPGRRLEASGRRKGSPGSEPEAPDRRLETSGGEPGVPDRRLEALDGEPGTSARRLETSGRRKERNISVQKTKFTAGELAERIGGELKAVSEIEITGVRGAPDSEPGYLTYAEDRRNLELALKRGAGLILLPADLYQKMEEEVPALLVENPRRAYARLAELFPDLRYLKEDNLDDMNLKRGDEKWIHPGALVAEEAELGSGVKVMAGAIIGSGVRIGAGSRIGAGCILVSDIRVGEDCLLHPGVKVMPGTEIGSRVEIQSGAVLGSDGFGYATEEGKHYKIPQQGGVIIEDEVEIGALTAVDRGTAGETRIGAGSKIDNLVQISHNVKIGPGTLIAGQSGVAGSTTLGSGVVLAGQVGVEDHVELADGVTITGKAKVSRDIKEPGVYSGIPAQEHRVYLRQQARLRRLERLQERVEELEDKVNELLD